MEIRIIIEGVVASQLKANMNMQVREIVKYKMHQLELVNKKMAITRKLNLIIETVN